MDLNNILSFIVLVPDHGQNQTSLSMESQHDVHGISGENGVLI